VKNEKNEIKKAHIVISYTLITYANILNNLQMNPITELVIRGVAVIPLPDKIFNNFNLDTYLHGQREFKVSNPTTMFVLGAFGALANPSSQHHPEARKLRSAMYSHMCPLFATAFAGKYVELIPDRFSIRSQDQPISAESWHQDATAEIGPNDVIYGGYLNLDERQTQYFSCIPSSHLEPTTGEGFAKMSKENTKAYNARREIIAVPPKCAILFNEKTVHEIARRKIKETKSYRQYFKWRISEFPVSTLGREAVMTAIEDQAPFPLHAIGATPNPPMYGKMHIIHWGDRIEKFSENIHDAFLCEPNAKGQVFVQRFMKSLCESGIEPFPAYTEEEREMLFPQLLVKIGRL
jgi:hypothetical protein